jgi:hypothetical protein
LGEDNAFEAIRSAGIHGSPMDEVGRAKDCAADARDNISAISILDV